MKGLMYLSELEQVKAVENGDKPMACVSPDRLNGYAPKLDSIKLHLLACYWVDGEYGSQPITETIYYAPGKRKEALALKEIWEDRQLSNEAHRSIGKLLGYEESEIDEFISALNTTSQKGTDNERD